MIEYKDLKQLDQYLKTKRGLDGVALQGLDLTRHEAALQNVSFCGALLLGCTASAALEHRAVTEGALLFPPVDGLPYRPYRNALYDVEDLYDAFDWRKPETYADCLDARVYDHWKATGRAEPPSILETLCRRLHDHAITDAVEEFLKPAGAEPRKMIAIMGGHSMGRDEDAYRTVCEIARQLCRDGFTVASGGGPGAMEATHVGAWFAGRQDDEMSEAITMLAAAPSYKDGLWLSKAFEVRMRFPLSDADRQRFPSLGIPTWLYGHEPPNAFATHVAKYFANAVREEGLLSLAKHGVVFSPGSAGTIQEIFQDACQNHYQSLGGVSPMVFLGRDYWTKTKPVYPLLQELARGMAYAKWLSITDQADEAVTALKRFAAQAPVD